jgi:phosphoglycolate phosphatase-like HAD superfamily hydrolase
MAASRPSRLFLDFDGVIMDSMALKLESYLFALSRYDLNPIDLRRVQLRSAGLSRVKTLPLMVQELLGHVMDESELAEAVERFRISDEANRSRMQLLPGALEFLAQAKAWNIPMFILTGTPQEVIEETLRHFDLNRFFEMVLGSPPDKTTHLLEHTQTVLGGPQACLFVGDSPMDQAAAKAAQVPFAGLAAEKQDMDAFDPNYLSKRLNSLLDLVSHFE